MATLIMIIMGIGALIVGIPALFIGIYFYWIAIPLIGLSFGGGLGFIFGVGLTFAVYVAKGIVKSVLEANQKQLSTAPVNIASTTNKDPMPYHEKMVSQSVDKTTKAFRLGKALNRLLGLPGIRSVLGEKPIPPPESENQTRSNGEM